MFQNILLMIALIFPAFYFIKWLLIILFCISVGFNSAHIRDKNNFLGKILRVPSRVAEKLLSGGGERYAFFEIGTIPSHHIRKMFYKIMGVQINKNVVFHLRTNIRNSGRLIIGENTIIGDNATLDARSGLLIGKNVNFSSNVSVWTLQHDLRMPDFGCPNPQERKLDVKIEDRVWLGFGVTVLPGVTIGEGAVCCAGCVVTKDVAPYTVVAGIPAKKIGERPRNLSYEFNGKSCRLY